jgi:catechol 2,3-dioxygenase-like lactoylglutathione lyase family enzyme
MTDLPLIRGTDFVFVPVTSFARAERFYCGVLGLECSARYRDEIGGEFETGTLTIQVIDAAKIGQEFRQAGGAIALRVEDVASARAALESRGVSFLGETMDSGVCHQAVFADEDGNKLILHHRYAPRQS